MHTLCRNYLSYSLIVSLAVILGAPAVAQVEEVAPFRITRLDGNVSLRYLMDEQNIGSGFSQTNESRTTLEEEIFILAHGYMYHPNLVNFDIGGGPVFTQIDFESTAGNNDADDVLYNFIGRFNFLEQKPYPFSIFYEQSHPSLLVSFAEQVLQENTKYGFNTSLREPLSPVLISIDASRSQTQGEGRNVIIDDDIEQASLRAYRAFASGSFAQLVYRWNTQESESGSPGLPIQLSDTTVNSTDFNSRSIFGSERQFNLTTAIGYSSQTRELGGIVQPKRRDIRFSPDLRWSHTEALESFYRYDVVENREGSIDTRNQTATIGLRQAFQNDLNADVDVHAENNETTGLSVRSRGVAGSLTYRRAIPSGNLQLSYGLRYDRKDQEATQAVVNIVDERVTLTGTTRAPLNHPYVVPGSIVVTNLTASQTYVEGFDYIVEEIGSTTYITRLIAGNITDGQEVLVDYAYESGGTFEYTLFDQNAQANLTFLRHLNVFVRYYSSEQTLEAGIPSLGLNSVQSLTYGGGVSLPFWQQGQVGGNVTFEDHDEDLAPFERKEYDVYVQIPLPLYSSLRVSGRRTVVDNKFSVEDMDITGYSVLWQARPWFRTRLTAEATYEEDTGGTLDTERWVRALNAEWRIRKLILTLEGRFNRELQGRFERDKTLVRAIVKREF